MLGILMLGVAACNDEANKQLPVFTETVEFENTSMAFNENAGEVRIPVILSGFAKEDVKVTVEVYTKDTRDTTAVEGVHFTLPQKTITIPAGESIGEIPMTIINDNTVNVSRVFRLQITVLEGADHARISQITRVTIVNEDFWPVVQFSAARYSITEHEDLLVIPMSALGIFYQPMDVRVNVTDGTAVRGVNYEILETNFHFEDSTRTELLVTIPHQDLNGDLDFTLDLEVLKGGVVGKYKSAKVTIKDVQKFVRFGSMQTTVLANANPMLIPVMFTGVRSSRDITATIGVKNAGGLAEGDYTLEDNVLTSKGDTTLYAKFRLREGVAFPAAPIEFEILDVEGGEINETVFSTELKATEGEKIDPTLKPWEALSWTTEEPSGEGADNGHAVHMIDGKMDTFWHSRWQGGEDNPPFEIVVDMNENIEVGKIGLYRRQPSNGDTYKATVEISKDKQNWEGKIEFDFTAGGLTQNGLEKVLPVSVTGRYLRVTVTACRGTVASLAEVTVWGIRRK